MAIESRYNPVAESSMGAKGLMQVIPRFHPEKLIEHGGDDALLDPEVNIRVGTWVLHEYLRHLGDLESALQKYAGALDEPTSHLDIRHQLNIYRMMRRLAHDWPMAVVCVSHDVNVAARLADELVLMRAGLVVAAGTPEALRTRFGAATLEDAFVAAIGDARGLE